jgi:MoaA/NifB/PqqE/SkfB family radical SAM enzyme
MQTPHVSNPNHSSAFHQLWRITLDTNPEDCNLRCTMCEEHSPFSTFIEELYQKTGHRRRRMPFTTVQKVFEEASRLGVREIIPSTMGEPLLYKDFDQLLGMFSQYGIKCNLTTNGTFPKRSVVEWAALIVPVTSDIKISWNGATKATAEKVMLDLDFDQAVHNVREFVRIRDEYFNETGYYCRVTFQLTFMQNNMHELADMVKLAADLGVDRVKGHHLWAHFEQIQNLSFRNDAENIQQWNKYVEAAHQAAETHRRADGKKVLLEQITRLEPIEHQQVPYEYDCPFLGKELWVSPTGNISPCCAPDHLRQGLGDFGNINQSSLLEVLESPIYRELSQNYKNIPLCQTCNMRK